MPDRKSQLHKLQQSLPWTQIPLVASAPMGGVATSDLALAVSKSGGLGQLGFSGSVLGMQMELDKVKEGLKEVTSTKVLPVGVGIICLSNSVQPWLQLFRKYQPATVWLSFGTTQQFLTWATGIRGVSPNTEIWIQVGDVASAVEVAKVCRPDALVLQGSDAGGHGHVHGASIITLVPEVIDSLENEGLGDISIIAAGGITDGRSAAAAIMLGASGIVMGTRYLGAEEAQFDADVREAVFRETDGGKNTVRSRVFDDFYGDNFWPETYDGRCLRGAIYDDFEAGMSIEEVQSKLYDASAQLGSVEAPIKDVMTVWAGTGVGMVKRLEKAGDITRAVREDAKKLLLGGSSWL
ncbi:NMO domain-containing protein [Fusarium sp. LHS14.1]|nr:NMO domain-containing protein [Fusarium sp. LHS14.1]